MCVGIYVSSSNSLSAFMDEGLFEEVGWFAFVNLGGVDREDEDRSTELVGEGERGRLLGSRLVWVTGP